MKRVIGSVLAFGLLAGCSAEAPSTTPSTTAQAELGMRVTAKYSVDVYGTSTDTAPKSHLAVGEAAVATCIFSPMNLAGEVDVQEAMRLKVHQGYVPIYNSINMNTSDPLRDSETNFGLDVYDFTGFPNCPVDNRDL